jgi:hypothetical protein
LGDAFPNQRGIIPLLELEECEYLVPLIKLLPY